MVAPSQPASCFFDVTHEDFALVNIDIRVADKRGEIVDDIPDSYAFVPPMPRHADLMDNLATDRKRAYALGYQGLGSDGAAWRRDGDEFRVVDTFLSG